MEIRQRHWLINVKLEDLWVPLCPIERFDSYAQKQEIEKALKKMKTSFGFGSDGIASHFIKIAFLVISHSLCRIYNLSIESGIFPDS